MAEWRTGLKVNAQYFYHISRDTSRLGLTALKISSWPTKKGLRKIRGTGSNQYLVSRAGYI